MLSVQNLTIAVGEKSVTQKVSFTLSPGELKILMGPNGSGKSSLAAALAGHPNYRVAEGLALLDGKDILSLRPDERSRLGLFVAFQKPPAIPGVPAAALLKTTLQTRENRVVAPRSVRVLLAKALSRVGLDEAVAQRDLFVGFSGGEAKRMELAQLLALGATYAVLDEPDSGLDVDGMQIVAREINALISQGTGVLLITHNPRILHYLSPQSVSVMVHGSIIAQGGDELTSRIEQEGFASFLSQQ